jgi:hypothetical protein
MYIALLCIYMHVIGLEQHDRERKRKKDDWKFSHIKHSNGVQV